VPEGAGASEASSMDSSAFSLFWEERKNTPHFSAKDSLKARAILGKAL